MKKRWISQSRRYLICVTSYANEVLCGSLLTPQHEELPFSSLSQLLILMESLLDSTQEPQAYTEPRRFRELPEPWPDSFPPSFRNKRRIATFELNVLFRQHSSWQGILQWQEAGSEQSFRSVLELVMLLDSALRCS